MDHWWHIVIYSNKFTDYTPEDLHHSLSASVFPTILYCSFSVEAPRQYLRHLKISFLFHLLHSITLSYHLSNVLSASEFREGYAQSLLSVFIHLSSAYLPLCLIMVWAAYTAHPRTSPAKSNQAFPLCTCPSIHAFI